MTMTQTELGLLVAGLALAGVLLGSLVAGGFALLTGWVDGRREHKRWLRERRYEVYTSFAQSVERVTLYGDTLYGRTKALDAYVEAINQLATLLMLGPGGVYQAAYRLLVESHKRAQATRDGTVKPDVAKWQEAKHVFSTRTRNVLRVPIGKWQPDPPQDPAEELPDVESLSDDQPSTTPAPAEAS
jgi:hypothetical protein